MKNKFFLFVSVAFLGMFEVYAQASTPCAFCTENHQAFDFWIGKWQVTNPNGSEAGVNKISKIENGSILREE